MFIQRAIRFSYTKCELLNFTRKTTFVKTLNYHQSRNISSSKQSPAMEETLINKMPMQQKPQQDVEKILRVKDIAKSQQDAREYRGLQLENGLKVLLISDPKTDKSAAALSVEVGYMFDPSNLPGLAHFCEHMLFLGTEKYPNENAYSTYLSENGGSSNAATYSNMTKYYFQVVPDKLEGALDRFAQFFIGPLFNESATERELNAVNSEHEKNLSADVWRVRQVSKHLADPTHPYSKFGTGNKDTLLEIPKKSDIHVREELIKFHQQWYSANIMSMAILGKESLNELEEMVVTKFAGIENKNIELPTWPEKPYGDGQYGKKVLILPIKDIRSLTLSFPTKDLDEFYKSSPENYISHLIGHEGKGSILSELRERGWCNDLMAGHSNTARGFGFFDISVDLTTEGFNHVDDIIELIFQYIKMMRREGPKKWIFEEFCNLNEMTFRFKDKESPGTLVSNIVHSMQIYPLEEVLTAPYLIDEWRPDLISELLDIMTPDNCRITVLGQSLESQTNQTEPHYKTKYDVIEIPAETVTKWKSCESHDKLKLPEQNPFIPTDFELMPFDAEMPIHPTIIYDSPILRVWHKQDTEFMKPKNCLNFDFSNPIVYSDPLNCNLTHMLVALFKDQLNEFLYDAEVAGLKVTVQNTSSGISVKTRGYSHKQQILLEKVLDHLFDFKIDPKRFEILKDEYIRGLGNFKAEQPYYHAIYYLALILTEHAWSKGELLDAMQLVTLDRLEQFVKEFFSRLHTECFIYGNVNKQKALDLSDLVKKKLDSTNSVELPLLARQLIQKREYKLPTEESYLFEAENEFHKSSCAEFYLQCGPQTDKSMVFIDLCSQILNEPCYNALRTKEQLGYIVFSDSRKVNGATGIRFIVQSTKHPAYVEERIEKFLGCMVTTLEEMTPEEFERHKEALAKLKLEKPKQMNTQFNRYLNEISIAQYHFERQQSEVAILKKITKEELMAYFMKYIAPGSSDRHVLSVHVVSTQKDTGNEAITEETVTETEPFVANETKHTKLTDLSQFKSSRELFAVARPFLDIRPKGARSKL